MNDVMVAPSFDPIWDSIYQTGRHMNRYPWDAVVSFVMQRRPRDKSPQDTDIIEIGCGSASNLWFAAREGFRVTGIDGSQSAIEYANRRFSAEQLSADLRIGDFTSLPFPDDSFDLAIDRAALTCTGLSVARRAIAEVHRVLRTGGSFFCNVYSDRHTSAGTGKPGTDGLTVGISGGTLTGVGQICLYDRETLLGQFPANQWHVEALEHVTIEHEIPGTKGVHGEWRVTVRKT